MLGILLLLLNNHKRFKETIHNISYTTQSISDAQSQNKKYFSDMYGHNYDIKTGHMVKKGKDKSNGHRGIIDTQTGKIIEDHIEQSISMHTEQYLKENFPRIKNRLDARRQCINLPHNDHETLYYYANGNKYMIYWDNEVKRIIDVRISDLPTKYNYLLYDARKMIKDGYSEEEVYEFYCWKGENIGYPIPFSHSKDELSKYFNATTCKNLEKYNLYTSRKR